jgi:vacuolar-type H+-ATPase subunit E/Vma4
MIGMNDAPDLQAILNETLQDIEASIESQHHQLKQIEHEKALLVAKGDQLRACRENLMGIRAKLVPKLPA